VISFANLSLLSPSRPCPWGPREGDIITVDRQSLLGSHQQSWWFNEINYNKKRKHYEYKASAGTCAQCKFRKKCTRSKDGRSLKRHARQDELEAMLKEAGSIKARRDIKHRQDLSERSFAWSTRYGYKRARWRNLWRMQIQDFLIAAVQNITILIRQPKDTMSKSNVRAEEVRKYHEKHTQYSVIEGAFRWIFGLNGSSLSLA